jgi:predicted outer membrane protein
MKKSAMFSSILAVAITSAGACAQAHQETATQPQAEATAHQSEAHFFHLKLVVEQVNDAGKIENARSYATTIAAKEPVDDSAQSIRTGARVPITTVQSVSNPSATEFQYIDVGVSFDIRAAREVGSRLGFRLVADISSIAKQPAAEHQDSSGHPVVRQNKWDSMVLVPIGKPTVVYSGDDLDDKGRMQVEVTATPVE